MILKIRPLFLFIFCLFVIASPDETFSETIFGKVNVYKDKRLIVQLDVEFADTLRKRKQGLMFRQSLPQKKGMFFIFDEGEIRVFWMKNTLIPLDMIFLSSDFQVVSFVKGAKPCKGFLFLCKKYYSAHPAKYVLEMNSGFIDKYGIDERARIEIVE